MQRDFGDAVHSSMVCLKHCKGQKIKLNVRNHWERNRKISSGPCTSAGYNHILTTIGSNSPVVKKQNKGLLNKKKHGEQETAACCLS